MFVGAEDAYADPTDTQWAYNQIQPSARKGYTLFQNWDHGSFMLANDMSKLMDPVLELVNGVQPTESLFE